jgi:ribonuclease P protein component
LNEFRFPRSRRLLKPAEFDRVFDRRRSQADGMLILYACENGLDYPRLGLVVSRKAGNAAVRARWKRCLREAFRLEQHELPVGLDLVVLPRASAAPTMLRVRESLRNLAARLSRQLGTVS